MDAKRLLDQFLSSGVATGLVAGLIGGGLARRTGLGGIARIGGLALVGTLAYQAWQRYQAQQSQLPPEERAPGGFRSAAKGVFSNLPGLGDLMDNQPPANSGFGSNAQPSAQQNDLGVAVLAAMIAAAKADGEVDPAESQRILGQMEQAGLSSDEKAFVMSELAKPINVDDVVKRATTPEIAAQLYTASALVIDHANDAESDYLKTLAERMHLDQAFVDELNRQMKTLGG